MGLKKDYREITLPDSGEKVTVRALRSLDYNFCGATPDTLMPTFLKMAGKKDVSVQDIDPASAEYIVNVCIRGIVKHPKEFTLVGKQPIDCVDNAQEFSFYDLSNADQATLTDAVFSGGEGIPLKFLEQIGQGFREEQERSDEGQESG